MLVVVNSSLAPSSANLKAKAFPSPRLAPVMTATLPFNAGDISSSFSFLYLRIISQHRKFTTPLKPCQVTELPCSSSELNRQRQKEYNLSNPSKYLRAHIEIVYGK